MKNIFRIVFGTMILLALSLATVSASSVNITAIVGSPSPASPSPSLAITPSPTPTSSGGGSGGGGYIAPPPSQATVIFSGRAYPESRVFLLKDAEIAVASVAGPDANFQITLTGIAPGSYVFSIYTEDSKGTRSPLSTFPVSITGGATTLISGIFIAQTIAVDKQEVKRGDNLVIFGQSVPQSQITISVNSEEELFYKVSSDKDGTYLFNLDTSILELGQHLTKSKAALLGEISSFSKSVGFLVGIKNVLATNQGKCQQKADLNGDCRVNLVDFSILSYWYKRTLTAEVMNLVDLNFDKKVSIVDFSIMAFYWTG